MRSGISVGVQELLRHSVRQQWRFCGVLWPQQWALGGAQPTWECWVLTCSSSKHWGRWTRALWSPSRAGLSLVGSPSGDMLWAAQGALLVETGMHKALGNGNIACSNEGSHRAGCAKGLSCSDSSLLPREKCLCSTQLLAELCWASSAQSAAWGAIRASISRGFILPGVCRRSQWNRKISPSLPSSFIYHVFLFTISEGSGRNYKSDSCERDVLQIGWVGLCFVTTVPLPSRMDVLVVFLDFLSSHANSGTCVERE